MGDVTYGACCVDDLSASALGCSLLVHYGHSCLVPSLPQDDAGAGHGRSRAPGGASGLVPIPVLYVFVEIAIDTSHFVETVVAHIPGHTRLSLLGTVQFLKAVHGARAPLRERYGTGQGEGGGVDVPQAKPLSAGETLGCTAPRIARAPGATSGPEPESAIVFLADGRFHPEAAMLMNPGVPLYRYDPYSRLLTREEYDHAAMRAHRTRALESARGARVWGLILGTLGRQGSPALLLHLRALLSALGREHVVVLLSEIFPAKLALFRGVDAWVQVREGGARGGAVRGGGWWRDAMHAERPRAPHTPTCPLPGTGPTPGARAPTHPRAVWPRARRRRSRALGSRSTGATRSTRRCSRRSRRRWRLARASGAPPRASTTPWTTTRARAARTPTTRRPTRARPRVPRAARRARGTAGRAAASDGGRHE